MGFVRVGETARRPSAVARAADRLVGKYAGMTGFVKSQADLLSVIGGALTLSGSLLNLIAVLDQPDGIERLAWRARFVAVNRRHPRLRGT